MGLFGKKKGSSSAPPAEAPPVVAETPASAAADTHTATVLRLELPDVFAFQADDTRAREQVKTPVPLRKDGPTTERGTILLVESDPEISRLLGRLLQHEGFGVSTASCLAEARQLAQDSSFQYLLARRACVPLNLQTEIALRDLRGRTTVRIVDEFSDLMLGQVVDYESMSRCYLGVADLLLSLLEGANVGARGHAHNVAKYCRLLGQRLGLPRRDLDALILAAQLHDLGALATRHQIGEISLQRQELLSPSLRPTLELLANIEFPYPINDLLAATPSTTAPGLPDSTTPAAPALPLGTRILQLVDAYETLRRSNQGEFQDEDTLFAWLRKQPTELVDADVLETLIHIRKNERTISAMNIFWAAVLLVDPHPEDVQLLKLRLENDDYHVLVARTIDEALQLLRTENITLVLTEHALGSAGDGFELLRTIKNDPGLRAIPVVFHALGNTDLIKQALELGAEDWYAKPHNVEIIVMKLQRLIGRLHASDGAPGEGVQGNLRDLGLIEMVQILSAGGRSVQITVEQANQCGELVLTRGQVIHAAKGELRGEIAALEILAWREGTFRIKPLRQPPAPTITTSTDSLILQSCVRQDQQQTAARSA